MTLELQDFQILAHGISHSRFLTSYEILSLEEGTEIFIDSDSVPKPSSVFPSIDFLSSSFSLSSLKATVFIPVDNDSKRPKLEFVITDANYCVHKVDSISILNNYMVVDNTLCIYDEGQALELHNLLCDKTSSPIAFSEVAQLLQSQNQLIEFVYDDTQCVDFSSTIISSENKDYPLYPYQQRGASWLNAVVEEGVGCVLADEMGLGKTPQVIALITNRSAQGTSLVIVPNTLKTNWRREINKFSPLLSVFIYGGKYRFTYYKELLKYNVVITSYDTASTDFSLLKQITWNLIILDEAQAIKNANTKRSTLIRSFPKHSGIAVSGTPFENHVEDVWSIFDFCFHGLLGSLSQYKERYSDTKESADQIEKIISPLLLRRHVADVKKDLPDKVIIDQAIEMSESEAGYYEAIRQSCNRSLASTSLNIGVLQKLRQYCALPSIVEESLQKSLPSDISEKFNFLFEILNAIYQKHEKVLIFTRWKDAQQTIKESIENVYGVPCFLLNGDTPQNDRQKMVDDFSAINGFAALILNPEVGGTGLNITAANNIIFYTLEWNPSLEDQCIGRAARIGQSKVVMVYRLYYCDTVEDIINERLKRKRAIREVIIQGTDGEDNVDIMKALNISPFSNGVINDSNSNKNLN